MNLFDLNQNLKTMSEELNQLLAKGREIMLNKDQEAEEQLIFHLTARVEELLEMQPELLFSWMYRLDVLEKKIQFVLNSDAPMATSEALARLIWDRQKERYKTKMEYKSKEGEGDDFFDF